MDRRLDRSRWEKAIGRFKKSELREVAEDLELEGHSLPSKTASKRELVALIVEQCVEKKKPTSDLLRIELSRM